jgi:hypothetical protein
MHGRGAGGPNATGAAHPASRRGLGPEALLGIAGELAGDARWDGLCALGERRWRLISECDDFVAWLIAWPPGGMVELHDHGGSSGAVAMVAGELIETTVRRGDGRHRLRHRPLAAGDSLTFGAHHVHDIANLSHTGALSVHVYSPRLTSMTFYSLDDGLLRPTRRQAVVDCPEEISPALESAYACSRRAS